MTRTRSSGQGAREHSPGARAPRGAARLPEGLRGSIRTLSGVDLSDVAVHYGSRAPSAYGAAAFARGPEIHLAPGQERHLAHEAWHVVQQRRGGLRGRGQDGELLEDPAQEREADAFGALAARMGGAFDAGPPGAAEGTPSVGPGSLGAGSGPVQPKIVMGPNGQEEEWGQKRLKDWKQAQAALSVRERQMLNEMRADRSVEFRYESPAKLKQGLKAAMRREDWYANGSPGAAPDQVERRELSKYDPEFMRIHHEIMDNHQNRPYATDALHETGPLMGAWMNGNASTWDRMKGVVGGLGTKSTWAGQQAASRPGIQVTRIEALRNPKVMRHYAHAKQQMATALQPDAGEKSLYSGHGAAGMGFIEQHGHDPSYGPYDGSWFGKGHGAHGRGAYFTDRVDKAVSYSSKGQGNEERAFFKQDVLLGNTHAYTQRGRYRRRHHNEMVRAGRAPVGEASLNKTRMIAPQPVGGPTPEGESEANGENMGQYDSLTGQETAQSGGGLWGTIRDRKAFDSTEYMVRNADQVLPRYRINYRLT